MMLFKHTLQHKKNVQKHQTFFNLVLDVPGTNLSLFGCISSHIILVAMLCGGYYNWVPNYTQVN